MNVCLLLNEQDEMYYKLYCFTAAATSCLYYIKGSPIPPSKMPIIPLDSTTLYCQNPLHTFRNYNHYLPQLLIGLLTSAAHWPNYLS